MNDEVLEAVLTRLPPAAIGTAMAGELMRAMPEIQRLLDADFRSGLERSCTANVAEIWSALRSRDPDHAPTPPADATAWAYELVHRGVELPALLRAYRLGQWFVLGQIEATLGTMDVAPEVRWGVLTGISNRSFAYVDAVSTQLVDAYEGERAQWIRGAAAARAELVNAILAGKAIGPGLATDKLRYDVSRRHVAMIIWGDGALERAAVALGRDLGAGPVLTIPVGERVVWAWATVPQTADECPEVTAPDGLCAALGPAADGIAGMVASHQGALEARRVAELLRSAPGTALHYRSVALTALLTRAPEAAQGFARAELGDLAAGDESTERLRETLRAYLAEHLSAVRAARLLHVHQNTVVYRVKRAEELLGHPVDERRLELEVALQLVALV